MTTSPLDGIRVVDAHHHLWQLDAVHYPWLMERGTRRFFGDPTPIRRDYRAEDFRADAAGIDLVASVHIQVGAAPGQALAETDWLEAEAARPGAPGFPHGIVAFCDLAATNAPAALEAQAARRRVRGVRQIVGRSAEEDRATGTGGLLGDPVWRSNLARLPGLGLSFDLQANPWQLADCARVLAAVPDLKVALVHCGSPWGFPWRDDPAARDQWRAGLRALAALPNLHAKVSGLAMFNHGWDADAARTVIAEMVEAFGPERLMVGSNFPVDKLHKPYAAVMEGYAAILADLLGRDALPALFGGNAVCFYRLDGPQAKDVAASAGPPT